MIVSTIVRSHEDTEKVMRSVKSIFPDWNPHEVPRGTEFPVRRDAVSISGEVPSIDHFLSILRENRVLDTALDAMAMKSKEDGTSFKLSRQSASIGKVSFVLEGSTLGGVIEVSLVGQDIVLWLEQQTWHNGRENVPREVGDEFSMTEYGEATEWFKSSKK